MVRLYRSLWVFCGCVAGLVAGIGFFTFLYAEGLSYLSDDPQACANCHIMQDVYDKWSHSSHKAFATCNDCHTPHSYIGKYAVKALNGWNHSAAFTTGNFKEPIRIKGFNKRVVQDNCIYCHGDMASYITCSLSEEDSVDCLRCHGGTGHGF